MPSLTESRMAAGERGLRLRRGAWWGMFGLVAVGLVVLLGRRSGLTAGLVVHTVTGFPIWAFACFVAASALNLMIGTWKWLLVMNASARREAKRIRFADALLATSLGELFGQVMPMQAGIALARALASRAGVGMSAGGNLGTTVYEQVFDAAVLVGALVLGVIGFAFTPGMVEWVVLVPVAIGCTAAISLRLPGFIRFGIGMVRMCLPRDWSRLRGLERVAGHVEQLGYETALRLTALSLLRYAVNLSRVAFLLAGTGLIAYALPVMLAFPLILGVAMLPITPGNLGILEWSWSAVLVSVGAPLAAAGLFAIGVRIIGIIGSLALLVIFGAVWSVRNFRAENS